MQGASFVNKCRCQICKLTLDHCVTLDICSQSDHGADWWCVHIRRHGRGARSPAAAGDAGEDILVDSELCHTIVSAPELRYTDTEECVHPHRTMQLHVVNGNTQKPYPAPLL